MQPVAILDDQELTRQGIKCLVEGYEHLQVNDMTTSFATLEKLVNNNEKVLLVIDYTQSSDISLEMLKQLREQAPHMQTLVISSDDKEKRIREVLAIGVEGFVTKDCSTEEIATAINSTANGQKFYCNKILDILMQKMKPEEEKSELSVLSNRELEVLTLIAKGDSSAKIADTLHLSLHTINTHRKNILKKLDLKSPMQLIIYAMNNGLISEE